MSSTGTGPAPQAIPGFYYDASKRKYFRIQPNHLPPSASAASSKYTNQAVSTSQLHRTEQRAQQHRATTRRAQNVLRDGYFVHPIFGFDLDVRLRGSQRGVLGDGIRRQYAYMLRPRTVLASGKPGPKFAVDHGTQALYTTAEVDGRRDRGREMCVTPLSLSTTRLASQPGDGEQEGDEAGSESEDEEFPKYDPVSTTPILNAHDTSAILPLSESRVIWASLRAHAGGDASNLYFSRKYASDSVPWRNWREEFGEWGTTVHQLQSVVWDIAAPPASGSENVVGGQPGSCIVLGTGSGIKLCHLEGSGRGIREMGALSSRSAGEECMTVSFKDGNVFMGGGRQRAVVFGDVRAKESVVRLTHGSAVSGLRKMRNDNLVLVNGLSKMSVYDLRFAKARAVTKSNGPSFGSNEAGPVLDFDVPLSMQQKRYGMGFDYDEELNIVASASTDFRSSHKVGLWDCGTGKRITVGKLTNGEFKEPVTCLQMLDLRGHGSSAKSILMMNGGIVEEWHV